MSLCIQLYLTLPLMFPIFCYYRQGCKIIYSISLPMWSVFLTHISRGKLLGQSMHICNFDRYCQIDFFSSYTNFHSDQHIWECDFPHILTNEVCYKMFWSILKVWYPQPSNWPTWWTLEDICFSNLKCESLLEKLSHFFSWCFISDEGFFLQCLEMKTSCNLKL